MVKITPDSQSVKEILGSVNEVVRQVVGWKTKNQFICLNSHGSIQWYQNRRAFYDSMTLAEYTLVRGNIQVEYAPIVQADAKLIAQFEEAMRVALLNNKA